MKRYTHKMQEPNSLEFRQNTVDDFYETTKDMIDDLLDLVTTKLSDCLEYGNLYTKSAVMEKLGFTIRYVKTFAFGEDFQGEH